MSYYDFRDTKNSILEIQRILRALDSYENQVSRVKPDGIYGEDTRMLVTAFQEKYGLSPTGIVDYETWNLLHSIDEARRDATKIARAVHIFPMYEEYEILPNSNDDTMYVIQYMLNEILNDHDDFNELTLNGSYDLPTQNAIRVLLKKSLNDDSPTINAQVFDTIANEYERVNSRGF
jgi:peptidoglycan hydrolase-like protein with peptidoglycan-binding domain